MTTVDWRTPVLFASTVMDDVCQPTRRGRATRRRASPLRPGRPVAAATPAIRGSTSRPASPQAAFLHDGQVCATGDRAQRVATCISPGRCGSSNVSVYLIRSCGVSSTYVPPKAWVVPERKLVNDMR